VGVPPEFYSPVDVFSPPSGAFYRLCDMENQSLFSRVLPGIEWCKDKQMSAQWCRPPAVVKLNADSAVIQTE